MEVIFRTIKEIERSSVHQLQLTQFRNYASYSLECEGRSVILTGSNGAGKTNLLEAVSLLAPGRGLRGAKLAQLHRQPVQEPSLGWAVSAKLQWGDEVLQFGTGQQSDRPDKRIIRIDGEPLKSQAKLEEFVSVLWQTPQMDGLFTQGNTERRLYFDRICSTFVPEHNSVIAKYDHLRRERTKLLSFSSPDAQWLSSIEQKMAESSLAIAAVRLEVMDALRVALKELHPAFPRAQIGLRGFAETALREGKLPAVEIEAQLASSLQQSRSQDAQTGRASHGAHKMELEVVFAPKGVEAAYCSTGEQKALMLSLLLAQAMACQHRRNRSPIILLDEVVAHLDESRRSALFETLTDLGCQSWMTGTDALLFEGFKDAQQVVL